MKILVLGGTGVISTAVVKLCNEKGLDVTCINRGNKTDENEKLGITVFKCDLNNKEGISAYLNDKQYDVVLDFLCYREKNIADHLDLLKKKVGQYILISTDSVYKVKDDGSYYIEGDELGNPIWSYSVGKIECENYLVSFCEKNKINWTIVRPAITFGNTRIPYGLMPDVGFHYFLVNRIKCGKYIPEWNHGNNVATMVRSEDFAKLFVPLIGNREAYGEIYNVCGDEYISNREILDYVSAYVGENVKTVNVEIDDILSLFKERVGEFAVDRAHDHKVSNAKIKKLSGEAPSISVKDGIAMTLAYYESNNYLRGIDYFFDGRIDRIINESKEVKEKQRFRNYQGGSYLKHRLKYFKGYHFDSKLLTAIRQLYHKFR